MVLRNFAFKRLFKALGYRGSRSLSFKGLPTGPKRALGGGEGLPERLGGAILGNTKKAAPGEGGQFRRIWKRVFQIISKQATSAPVSVKTWIAPPLGNRLVVISENPTETDLLPPVAGTDFLVTSEHWKKCSRVSPFLSVTVCLIVSMSPP